MAHDADFRPDIPSTARMYDYFLGGKDNYPADRKAAERAMAFLPDGWAHTGALENRRFLERAVSHLVSELGIRQFLDIGTGLPTMNNVHEVAQGLAPESRIVYVDHDPIVLVHARDMLHAVPGTTIIQHDLRDPRSILDDPELTQLLDLTQPVAVLLVAVLHFISDEEDPREIVQTLMGAVPPGSYLVISHTTGESIPETRIAARVWDQATASLHLRSREEVEALFGGFDLVEPGLVWLPQWHPGADADLLDDPWRASSWCGIARKA
jgi:hypothetical protein